MDLTAARGSLLHCKESDQSAFPRLQPSACSHALSEFSVHVVQEGDGNYTSSEPPNANATIARFVVIGGMPPATTRSSRNASSRSSFCVIMERAVHLQRCTHHEASLHARLIITQAF